MKPKELKREIKKVAAVYVRVIMNEDCENWFKTTKADALSIVSNYHQDCEICATSDATAVYIGR